MTWLDPKPAKIPAHAHRLVPIKLDLVNHTLYLATREGTHPTSVPITQLFDIDGEHTTEPEEAVTVVAGRKGLGWWAVEITPEDTGPSRVH